jgi:hypothetical protein
LSWARRLGYTPTEIVVMKKRTAHVAWMLTPAAVCAGAFLLGWLGASVGGRLTWLVVGGGVGGLLGLAGWTGLIVYLRDRKTPEES